MALTDFTTYDDIRAALGVSSEEIEDATLSLALYEYGLISDLEDIEPTGALRSEFATVAAIDPGDRTDVQSRFYQAMVMFSTYAVAKHLTTALPLFSPQDHTDGKAGFSRYASSPYKDTINEVKAQFERYKQRVEAAYAAVTSTSNASATVNRVLFAKSTPSTNVITG